MMFILYIFGFVLWLYIFVFIFLMQGELPTPRLIYNTLGRDLKAAWRFVRVQYSVLQFHRQNYSVGKLFQQQVKKHPNKSCFLFEDTVWTYQEVEDYSNRVANAFAAAGYKKGDEVALFMENRPEYVCIWLGLSKIGVISALINTNLRLDSLIHSVKAITPKAVIFNANLALAVKEVAKILNGVSSIDFMCLDPIEGDLNSFHVTSLDFFLQDASKSPPDDTKYQISSKDKLLYIYTSGTTGLPKAAIIRHCRFFFIGAGMKFAMKVRDDDIAYTCLPLYHSAGGILFTSNSVLFGGTLAIRKKFSASNFWKDVIKYKATITQYIGEICRYLLNQPSRPEETQHTIRMMTGNGLRPQLWEQFRKRFKVELIIELYGATEGNANVFNMFGRAGAVGFISRLFPGIYPVSLIKVNSETGEPHRDGNGLCIRCKPGEPGAIVGKILRNNPINSFDGYANSNATKQKIIRNCFKQGDEAFHSGDILIMDDDGYLYFMDRTGDTFRWKGENVSTNEVEAVVSKALDLATCVVYGVAIPGTEGKAGMAAIQTEKSIDMNELPKRLADSLPTYAIPIFLRICRQIEATGTYKLRKVELQKDGFNPALTTDPVFMLDSKTHSYVRLDEEGYNRVIRGEVKL